MEVNRILVDQDPAATPEEKYMKRLKRVVAGIRSGELDATLIAIRMPDGKFGFVVNTNVGGVGKDERAQEEFELGKVR